MYRPILRQAHRRILAASRPVAARGYAAASAPEFDWQDPLGAKNLFTEEELAIAETAESYCQERMLPRVLRRTTFSRNILLLTALDYRGLPRRELRQEDPGRDG